MVCANSPLGRPFEYEGGRTGILLLHGFTATCAQMRPLADKLRDAGYTVSVPLLPGHGTTIEDMERSNWKEWLACAKQAYVRLQEKVDNVIVAGLSMGGTLALLLAEEYMPDGCIAIAPAISLRNKTAWLAGLAWPFMPRMAGGSENRGEDYLHSLDVCYGATPVKKVADLNRLRARAMRNLALIACPLFVIQPAKDTTVDPKGAKSVIAGVQSEKKKLLMLENSPHVCTLGPERERLNRAVLDFLAEL
ncbi:MAG: alpha/beta fold hydrolase [Clostridiales bacterium]|nr:alpha/beta fold hydrolase [Clostridiales bacterium]